VVLKMTGSLEKEEMEPAPKICTTDPVAGSSLLPQAMCVIDLPQLGIYSKSYDLLPQAGSRVAPCLVVAQKKINDDASTDVARLIYNVSLS
jgi:hypothetical protein